MTVYVNNPRNPGVVDIGRCWVYAIVRRTVAKALSIAGI